MSQLIINGGKNLKGIWSVSGNKNEALPLIAASCFFTNGMALKRVPQINDVQVMLEIAKSLGVEVKTEKEEIKFSAPPKIKREVPAELASKIRGSLLFIPALLRSHGDISIPLSGGDKIGARKIDTHLEVLRSFGAEIKGNRIILSRKKTSNNKTVKIWLSEPSVTSTENALLMASSRAGKTIIKNSASEPHVVSFAEALIKAGVNISGLGTNLIQIEGVREFKKINHEIKEDYMEIGSTLVLSSIFGGNIKIKAQQAEDYQKIFEVFGKFKKKIVQKNGFLSAVDNKNFTPAGIEEISDGPWPNFPSDLMSPLIILATQSPGEYLFHEKMFESRLYFTDQLRSLGAQFVLCDPHRLLVVGGKAKLKAAHLVSPDIRAGMALIIAALVAKGTSIIDNAQQLDRGYENLIEKLKGIGADIKRI